MEMLKNLATLACFMIATLALVQISYAQNLPQNYVDAHNANRSAVGVGNIVWDTTLATYAQNYANQRINDCSLVHSGGPYGENLAWGSGISLTASGAVQMWASEKTYYTYSTNTCATGKVCGHYTQVVWANSIRLGCARVQCNNNAGVFIICSYDPRGNVVGQSPY